MSEYTVVDVHIWGRRIARLAEAKQGSTPTFQFDPDYRRGGFDVSPLELPLSDGTARVFPELTRSDAFEGLPGVIADSLPDRFGSALIRAHFEQSGLRGRPSPLQKLMYVGDRGPGALEYRPAEGRSPAIEEALEVQSLVRQARRVVEGRTDEAIAEIIQVGATAGGARPKALILWDERRNEVRSGHASPKPDDRYWMIKFDGVTRSSGGISNRVTGESQPWGRLEYAYSRMARAAGIDMARTHLMKDVDGLAHFMTERFDRPGGRKLHLHSLGGLLHLDYNVQFQIGYEQYFDTMRALGLGQDEVDQAFKRMVFSVATVNYDDHLKNFAFLMDERGSWSLSPAYDVSFAKNDNWTRQHQMSINGKFLEITRADCIEVAQKFDISLSAATAMIDEVLAAVAAWPDEARAAGVTDEFARGIWSEIQTDASRLSTRR